MTEHRSGCWPTELVVPLDGSRLAERALHVAGRLARHLAIGVRTVTCAEAVGCADVAGACARSRTLAQWGIEDPAPAVEVVARLHAELPGRVACVSSHGRGGPGHGPLGGVADALIRSDQVPVLVVGPSCPSGWLDGGGPVVGCLTEEAAPDEGTNAAVVAATRRWARALGHDARLVTVVTTGAHEGGRVPGVEVLCSTHPAAAIQSSAVRDRASLLVLGPHRGGAAGGSRHVMRPLLAGAPCPVFVPSASSDCAAQG